MPETNESCRQRHSQPAFLKIEYPLVCRSAVSNTRIHVLNIEVRPKFPLQHLSWRERRSLASRAYPLAIQKLGPGMPGQGIRRSLNPFLNLSKILENGHSSMKLVRLKRCEYGDTNTQAPRRI